MIMPYLQFGGDCEEALAFYARVFGGKVEALSRFTQETGGPALSGKVMHGFVSLGTMGGLSGADVTGPVRHTDAMQILVHCKGFAEAEALMGGLSEGGQVVSPMTPHPPPDDAGAGGLVRDRYGYVWILASPAR